MPEDMSHDVDSTSPTLLIATPTYDGRLHHGYVDALMATCALLDTHGIGNGHLFLAGWSLIPEARNEIAARFLATPSWSHLLMVDSDIVWRPAEVLRLLRHGHELVCGVYARKSETDPALMFWRIEAGTGPLPRCARTGCLEIAATGSGFMMVHRSVFVRLAASGNVDKLTRSVNDDRLLPCRWDFFPVGVEGGVYYGEDVGFCRRWRAIGGRLWMDPTVTLGHVGERTYSNHSTAVLAQAGTAWHPASHSTPGALPSSLIRGDARIVRAEPSATMP